MKTTNPTLPYILRVTATRGIALPDLASAARAFVEADMVGRGSSFYTRGKGDILDAKTGEVVARVSPNGRVWAGAKYVPGATPIAERWEDDAPAPRDDAHARR